MTSKAGSTGSSWPRMLATISVVLCSVFAGLLVPADQASAQTPTTTALTWSPTSPIFRGTVTLTATVESTGGVPGGEVSFYSLQWVFMLGYQYVLIGTVPIESGVATIDKAALLKQTYKFVAVYEGSESFEPSTSNIIDVPVSPAPTSTSIGFLPTSPTYGESVTLTATVTAPDGPALSGRVAFFDGPQHIGGSSVSVGTASIQISRLGVGIRSIRGVYYPQGGYLGSDSPPTPLTVAKAAPAITLTSSANPSRITQSVTFTARVTGPAGVSQPTGAVTFYDGTTVLGTSNLSAGQARFTTSTLTRGNHPVRAEYFGDVNYLGAVSPTLNQAVKYGANVAVSASASQVKPLQPVTLTATVTSTWGVPTGTVTFLARGVPVQTVALSGGTARLTTTALDYGPHVISARYNGSPLFVPAEKNGPQVLVTYALGDAQKLNLGVAYRFTRPSAAGLADGGAVVVWENQRAIDGPRGILARRMVKAGTLGGEIVVAEPAEGLGANAVAGLTNGDYVVVWHAGPTGHRSVFARRFAANGAPRAAAQRVNVATTRDNALPRVAALADGGFIVVWQSATGAGTGADIHARRFNGAGVPAIAQFLVNTTVAGEQTAPVVARLGNGNTVVAWASSVSGGHAPFLQLFLPSGQKSGTERRASPETMSALPRLAVTSLVAPGTFALGWQRPLGAATASPDVYLQRYAATGAAIGPTTRLNPAPAGTQADPELAVLAGNHLVTAWSGVRGADARNAQSVEVQLFAPNWARTFVPFPANYEPNDLERYPAVTAYNSGQNYLVAFSDVVSGATTGNVFLQRFAGPYTSSTAALGNLSPSLVHDPAASLVEGMVVAD